MKVHKRPVALAKLSVPTHHLSLFRVLWRLGQSLSKWAFCFKLWMILFVKYSVTLFVFSRGIKKAYSPSYMWGSAFYSYSENTCMTATFHDEGRFEPQKKACNKQEECAVLYNVGWEYRFCHCLWFSDKILVLFWLCDIYFLLNFIVQCSIYRKLNQPHMWSKG